MSETIRMYQVKRDGHMCRIDVPRGAVHMAIGSTVVAREDDGKPMDLTPIRSIDFKHRTYQRVGSDPQPWPVDFWTNDDPRWEIDPEEDAKLASMYSTMSEAWSAKRGDA